MNRDPSKGLFGSGAGSLFVQVPVWISKKILERLVRVRNVFVRTGIVMGLVVLSVGSFWVAAHFRGLFRQAFVSGWAGFVLVLVLFYGVYVVLTFPLFFLLAYAGSKESEKHKQDLNAHRRKKISGQDIERAREKAGDSTVYLGTSYWNGKPYYLTDPMRLMHTHVVGSTQGLRILTHNLGEG